MTRQIYVNKKKHTNYIQPQVPIKIDACDVLGCTARVNNEFTKILSVD